MAGYIAPEYEEIEQSLIPFLKEHDIDLITVSSLIRGSIEVLEPEIPTASVAAINGNDLTSGISLKLKNIKVNLKFALNSIFSFKSVCSSEGIWLILAILKAIVSLLGEIKVDLDAKEAIVLFCIYRLQSATPGEIIEYAEKLRENGKETDIQIEDVNEALEKLERIRTIKLENGKYLLCEKVLVSKS